MLEWLNHLAENFLSIIIILYIVFVNNLSHKLYDISNIKEGGSVAWSSREAFYSETASLTICSSSTTSNRLAKISSCLSGCSGLRQLKIINIWNHWHAYWRDPYLNNNTHDQLNLCLCNITYMYSLSRILNFFNLSK